MEKKMRKSNLLVGSVLLCLGLPAAAQSISPDTFSGTIAVGETISINKTITLGDVAASSADIFFLADNTGSMGGIINAAQAGATSIMNALPSTYRFGAGSYLGDPSEGVPPATAFTVNQALTGDKTAVQTGINAWFAGGGGDIPEGNTFALREVAETTAWGESAQRLVVWFGDASSHVDTVTTAQAAAALVGEGVKVVAFNSIGEGSGIDGLDDFPAEPVGTRQATDIIAQTGGSLTNNFTSLAGESFVATVLAAIGDATSFLDLAFSTSFAGSGLDISFACTDALGCDDVGAGESRSFRVDITGVSAGIYDFSVFARGVDAVELDSITVTGGVVAVPEPSTYALMLGGLGVVGWMTHRRRRQSDHR
jgi:hypothetical protein